MNERNKTEIDLKRERTNQWEEGSSGERLDWQKELSGTNYLI